MKTILVVDDEVDITSTLQWYLDDLGYRVLVAYDGRDGLAKVIEHRPDLIVTDIMMPRMDGRELIERVRSTSGMDSIPIIVMSARDGIEHTPFLRKPFDPAELADTIGQLLEDGG